MESVEYRPSARAYGCVCHTAARAAHTADMHVCGASPLGRLPDGVLP